MKFFFIYFLLVFSTTFSSDNFNYKFNMNAVVAWKSVTALYEQELDNLKNCQSSNLKQVYEKRIESLLKILDSLETSYPEELDFGYLAY